MPVKKVILFLVSLLIIFSTCPFAILSAYEPQTASAIDTSRHLKIGFYENEPKIFTGSDGKASGFWADIVKYIADSEGWQIEWVHGSWEECLNRLEAGEIDIMPDVTYTEQRAQLYDFSSEVLLVSWSRIYAAKGVSIQSILDLEGKTIAVMRGSVNVEGPEGIKELASAFNINCIYLELDNYTEVFEAADSGQADAAVVNKDFGNSRAGDYNIEMTGIIFQPSQIYFAFSKNGSLSAELIETIDNYITGFKADHNSMYYNALEKWLSVEAIEKAVIPVWVWWVVGIFLAVICLLVAGAFILNLMVKQKTRQLRAEVDKQIRTEKKYTSLVEQSTDGIVVIQEGKIVFANREIMRMSGFSIAEIKGKSLVDFVSPRYKELVSQNYAKRMAGEDISGSYELEITRKDGRVVAVEINASVIEHEGCPADMAFVRDITERKKAEEQLAENQARYRSLFENSSDATLLTVPDGRILAANSAACRMFGRSEEEICRIGRNGLMDIADPRLAVALEERRRTGEFRGELTFVRSDNSKFTGEVSSRIFYDRKGNPETTMIIRDVTRRREAEEKLKESEAKYRLLVENVPVGVIIIRNGKVLFANRQDEQITGYTLEELQSMKSFDIIYEEDRSRVIEYAAMRARGEPATNSYTVRIIRKDGALRWLRRNVVRIDWLGEPASLLIDLDVTEQLETEKALADEAIRRRILIEQSRDGIVILDQDGQVYESNKRFTEMIGYSDEEVKGLHVWDWEAVASRKQLLGMLSTVDEKGDHFETKHRRKDGSVYDVEISSNAALFAGQKLIFCVCRDITERKQADIALKREKDYISSILNTVPGIIVTFDTKGRVIGLNNYAEKLLGYPADEIIGKDWLTNFIPRREQERVGEDMAIASTGVETVGFINPVLMKNGQERLIEWYSTVLKDKDGNITSLLAIGQDVTERLKAEQALADEAIRRRILIEQSRDGIVILGQDGNVYESNKRFTEMIGYSDEEVKELHVWDWEAVASRKQLLGMLGTVDEKGDHFETKHRRKDGSVYDVEISTNAALFAGQKLIFCVCRDITERKKAQQELKREKEDTQRILDTAQTIILTLDIEGRIVHFNPYMTAISGYSIDEVRGKDWFETFLPERNRGKTREMFNKSREMVKPKSNIDVIVTRSGEERFIEWYFIAIKDKEGNTLGVLSTGQDITEHKKAEEELRQAYNVINRSKMVAFVWKNEQGWPVDFVTENTEQVLGYKASAFISGKVKYSNIIHPDDMALVESEVSENSRELSITSFEHKPYRIITGDGKIIWVSDKTEIIRNENGSIKYYQGVIEDISERLIAEKKIQVSEEKYRTLFETMQQGVVFWDNNGKLISANSATEKIFGLTLVQMQGKNPAEVIPMAIHEDGSLFPKDIYPSFIALKSGKPVKDVLMGIFNTLENKYRWVVVNAMPQFKENEKEPCQVYTTFNDITQIKEIERALVQSESKLRQSLDSWETTFNSIKNAICLLALDGSIIRCNQAMYELVGKSAEEIQGRKCYEVVHGAEKPIEGCPHMKVVQNGRREAAEIAIGDKWYYVIVDPIFDSEGNVSGSIHTMDDITDRKNMEDRMIMADRLASIGELSSGIAHEVNNPLTGVIGVTQLLLARGNLPEDVIKDLNMVNDEAQRAARVVKNLLVFARKHANEVQFSSVIQALEKVLELRAYDQRNNNIQVIRNFAPDLPHIVMDYFQIQQVFLNIIINAEYAMKEAHNGGTLTIKTEKVGEMVRISFTDDGPGIPKKNLKHIFDPFFTTKEVGKGTGLGLSICHGIISQHHGNIYAKSEFGKGATFVVELPINQPEQAEEGYDGKKQ